MAKSVKNPQKNKEIKPKDDKTAQQEQCSVVAIYYYMTKDMKSQAVRDELLEKFKVIYPDVTSKDGIAWTNTFLEQGRLIANASEYVKKGASYQYGWWDAPPRAMNSTKFSQAIGRQNTTSLMTRIWDKYFDAETKKLFENKKDTWNTADMYMLRSGAGPEILRTVASLKKSFVDECCVDKGTFVGTLNTYLTKLLDSKILIPISLKKKTADVNLKIEPTNIHQWDESGGLDIVSANFVKSPDGPGPYPWGFFNVKIQSGKLKFGQEGGRGGNSFQYFANFKVGTYETEYLVEQRLTNAGTKAEVKEIKLTNKGKKTRAAAQSGSVPMPAFRDLVHEYSGERYDNKVPATRTPLTSSEVKYWRDYLEEVNSNNAIPFALNGFKVFGQEYPLSGSQGTVTWLDKVAEIDNAYLTNPGEAAKLYGALPAKFHEQFRLKLMQLRFLRAMQRAGNHLNTLIVHIYYLGAKQNVSEGDIHGPFLKVS